MKQKTFTSTINDIKRVLAPCENNKANMLIEFNAYLLENHQLEPETTDYDKFVELLRTKGGLQGYLAFMEI